jgi:hypothetical protein
MFTILASVKSNEVDLFKNEVKNIIENDLGIKNIVEDSHVDPNTKKYSTYLYVFDSKSSYDEGIKHLRNLRDFYKTYRQNKHNSIFNNSLKIGTTYNWKGTTIIVEDEVGLFSIDGIKPIIKIRVSDHSQNKTSHKKQNKYEAQFFCDFDNNPESIRKLLIPLIKLSTKVDFNNKKESNILKRCYNFKKILKICIR